MVVTVTPNRLRERRRALEMSQRQLAAAAGLCQAAVSDFERGVRHPWPKAQRELAAALATSVDELFPGEHGG